MDNERGAVPITEQNYPAVKFAYDFVLPSYQMLIGRFESADTRLTALLTMNSGLMLAAPVLGKAVEPALRVDGPFVVGLLCFAIAMLVGVYGRVTGTLTLPDPGVLHRESLHEAEWVFKTNAIFYAGQHFDKNARAIERKSVAALGVTALLILQMAALTWWIAR